MPSAEIRPIDVRHLGRKRVICAWLVGDVLIDCGPAVSVDALLEGLGDVQPRALALTHIHLDHAGAAGTLVKRWPALEVWVHERGAPHLIDPARLLASAGRLYGEQMARLWGEVRSVPAANLRILSGGERLGELEVAYTPGHASHHVSYLHGRLGAAFVGDVAGVRIAPLDYVLPPTPPPDIDIEAWRRSLELLRAWQPASLAITHFGAFEDVAVHLERMELALERAARRARECSREEYVAALAAELEATGDPAAYGQGAPLEQSYAGLERYWRKQAEREHEQR